MRRIKSIQAKSKMNENNRATEEEGEALLGADQPISTKPAICLTFRWPSLCQKLYLKSPGITILRFSSSSATCVNGLGRKHKE